MPDHPLVQIAHVGDGVHDPAGAQDVRVLGEERGRDDARLVLALFEVRVWEEEEEVCEGGAGEEVG